MDKDKQIKALQGEIASLKLTLYGMKYLPDSDLAKPHFVEGSADSPFASAVRNKFKVDPETGKMWHVNENGDYVTDEDGFRIDAGQLFRNRPDLLRPFRR